MAPGFKGDMPAIYDRLKSADCAPSAAVSASLMRELATAADAAREGNPLAPPPLLAPAPIPALPPAQARAP
jgi:hypothetical protein